jgi:predicted transglutaminase-like cysteine proteinase
MKHLIKIAVAVLVSTMMVTGPARSLDLAGATRNSKTEIGRSFIKEKQRVVAPFAHVMFCVKMPAECAPSSGPETVELTRERERQLKSVNRQVNFEIVPVNDSGNDVWSLAPREGDCEDYAITKRHDLIASGWPPAALRLALAYTAWGEGHLVLVVRTSNGDMVLDNLTGAVRSWRKSGLQWKMIQSAENPRIWHRV